jgi:hypothetical protein
MSSVISTAAAGMRAASARFEAAASQVARGGGGVGSTADTGREIDLPTLMVTMSLASYDFKAAAKVARIGRDMMQSAIDLIA